MSDLYIPKPYPKAIYKDGDVKIVQNPYEHAKMCDEGWSGPPEFGADIPELEALVEKTRSELAEMERRLADMKKHRDTYAPKVEAPVVEEPPAPPAPEPAPAEPAPVKSAPEKPKPIKKW